MIHAEQLTRDFVVKKETVHAVRGIDLHVAPGELVALLGPNGAGKSTTLRMLTTLLPPTSGSARVAGASVVSEPTEVRRRIGYVGQGNAAGHSYRVLDELVMQGRFYAMSRSAAAARAGELLASFDLTPLQKRGVGTLSGGQRRRLDVAMGLMHRPRLLFLDEPSTGMDPQNRSNLWDHILRLREEQGTTIVLTTHYLEEADVRAERVLVIDHGRIIADDTAANLKATLAGDQVSVTVAPQEVASAVPVLSARGREVSVGAESLGATVSARFERGPQALPWVLQELAGLGVTARAAEVRRPTLDDVFLSLTGRSLRDEGAVESASDEGAVDSAADEGAAESARDEGAVKATDLVHEDERARA
ncbi:MAG TPA: ATP-binding cassette domain-containing protein [Propionibacteriaceae bacterium]